MNSTFFRQSIRGLLGLAVMSALSFAVVCAQDSIPGRAEHFEFGVDPSIVITRPIGTLESVRGIAPCSDSYRPAGSVNLGGAIWANWILNKRSIDSGLFLRGLRLSVGIDDISSDFEDGGPTFQSFDTATGEYIPVTTRRNTTFALQYFRGALESEWAIGGSLLFRVGATIAFPLSGSAEEVEQIDAPDNATFLDGTQRHTVPGSTGPLDDPGTRVGLSASLAYRLPLGRSMFFEPVLGIDYGLTKIQPEWSPLIARAGITVGFGILPEGSVRPAVAIEPIVAASPPPPSEPRIPPFTPRMEIAAIPDGEAIEARREIVARYIPVLPTMFFDKGSVDIGSGYHRLRPTGIEQFSEQGLEGDAAAVYSEVLNVVGTRLRRYADANVTLTGSSSVDESDRAELSRERAEAVAAYLRNIWGIEQRRIAVRSAPDPSVPSNSAYEEGRAENRRVEISFDRDDLYKPIALRAVEPVTRPDALDFTVSVDSSASIAAWRVELRALNRPISKVEGIGVPPDTVRWSITASEREQIITSGDLSYALMLADESGRTVRIEPKHLPVHVDTSITVATSASKPDNAAEFLLITFDFDRAELSRRGREELKTIIERIGPDSQVDIVGYTDRLGEESHNRELALERARLVAGELPPETSVTYRGANPGEAPYADTTPQGRFLSRTVRVVITNPK